MKTLSLVVLVGALAACGPAKQKASFTPGEGGLGTIDKPATSMGSFGTPYGTALKSPGANASDLRSLIQMKFSISDATTAIQLTNTKLKASCSGVSYYFTWSELSSSGVVLSESAAFAIPVVKGHDYLLRLYATQLDPKCYAEVSYIVNPIHSDAPVLGLLWQQIGFSSYKYVEVNGRPSQTAWLKIELPRGVPKDSGELVLKVSEIQVVDTPTTSQETIVDIDGTQERLIVQGGTVLAVCTKDGVTQQIPVGTVSADAISLQKRIELSSPQCAETPRTLLIKRQERGLLDFLYDLPGITQVKATLAPSMGYGQKVLR